MKRPLLTSRRKVMSALINAYPGGRECAAAQLGLELKKFDNQAYESNGQARITGQLCGVLLGHLWMAFTRQALGQVHYLVTDGTMGHKFLLGKPTRDQMLKRWPVIQSAN